ncbi:CopG family ribbon-helix-helix protein [Sphingomonas sp.]|uniref:CopG family ribbon-helix-helix protein n=1 Tax=Sphingomonas sp. TaxID=28214 RepID=UPI003AFFE0DD
MTARIDEQLSADLDELAGRRERSRAWLIERAIAGFVADELELYRSLEEAEAQIDRGEYSTQEQVEAMFAVRGMQAQPG